MRGVSSPLDGMTIGLGSSPETSFLLSVMTNSSAPRAFTSSAAVLNVQKLVVNHSHSNIRWEQGYAVYGY